jgi:hypothetical protein
MNCTSFYQWVPPICENSCNSCLKFFGARRITRLRARLRQDSVAWQAANDADPAY